MFPYLDKITLSYQAKLNEKFGDLPAHTPNLKESDKYDPASEPYSTNSVYAFQNIITALTGLTNVGIFGVVSNLTTLPDIIRPSLEYLHADWYPQVIDEKTQQLAEIFRDFLPAVLNALADDLKSFDSTVARAGIGKLINSKLKKSAQISITALTEVLSQNTDAEQKQLLEQINTNLTANQNELKTIREQCDELGFEIPPYLDDATAVQYAKNIYDKSNAEFRKAYPTLFSGESLKTLVEIAKLKNQLINSLSYEQKIELLFTVQRVKLLQPMIDSTNEELKLFALWQSPAKRNASYEKAAAKLRKEFKELKIVTTINQALALDEEADAMLGATSILESISNLIQKLEETEKVIQKYNLDFIFSEFRTVMNLTRAASTSEFDPEFQKLLDYYSDPNEPVQTETISKDKIKPIEFRLRSKNKIVSDNNLYFYLETKEGKTRLFYDTQMTDGSLIQAELTENDIGENTLSQIIENIKMGIGVELYNQDLVAISKENKYKVLEVTSTKGHTQAKSYARKQIEKEEQLFAIKLHAEFRKQRDEYKDNLERLQKTLPGKIRTLELQRELLPYLEKIRKIFLPNSTLSFELGEPPAFTIKDQAIEKLIRWINDKKAALSQEFDKKKRTLQIDFELINAAISAINNDGSIEKLPDSIPKAVRDKLTASDTDKTLKITLLNAYKDKLDTALTQLAQQQQEKLQELQPHEENLLKYQAEADIEASLKNKVAFEQRMQQQREKINRLRQEKSQTKQQVLQQFTEKVELDKFQLQTQADQLAQDFKKSQRELTEQIEQTKQNIVELIQTYGQTKIVDAIEFLDTKQDLIKASKNEYIPELFSSDPTELDAFAIAMNWNEQEKTQWQKDLKNHAELSKMWSITRAFSSISIQKTKDDLLAAIEERKKDLTQSAEAKKIPTENEVLALSKDIQELAQLRTELVIQEEALAKLKEDYEAATGKNARDIAVLEQTSSTTLQQMNESLQQYQTKLETALKEHIDYQNRYYFSKIKEYAPQINKVTEQATGKLQQIKEQDLKFNLNDSSEAMQSKINAIDAALLTLRENQSDIEKIDQWIEEFKHLGLVMEDMTIQNFNKYKVERQSMLAELEKNKKALEFTLPKKFEEEKLKARKDTTEAVKILNETKTSKKQEETRQAYETLNNLIQDIGKMSAIQFFQKYPNPDNDTFNKWRPGKFLNTMQPATDTFVAQQKKHTTEPKAGEDLTTTTTLAKYLSDRETKFKWKDKFSSTDREARKKFVGRLITALQSYSESNNDIVPNSFPQQVEPGGLYKLIEEGLAKFKPRTTNTTNPEYQKSLHFQLKQLERNLNYNEDGLHNAAEKYQTSVKDALTNKLRKLGPPQEITEREHTDYRQFPGRS